MKLKFALLALALAWFGHDGVRAEEVKEPTVAELQKQVAALTKENATLRESGNYVATQLKGCQGLVQFYQADAQIKQLDAQKSQKVKE